jgi:hypothetical protein
MNPFTTPDKIFISLYPQDMRAGIQTLAACVLTDFEEDPQNGSLYCFVSRDCEKVKMLRFDVNGWCLYYCRLAEGIFHWQHRPDYENPKLAIDRLKLHLLLDGLDTSAINLPSPVTANTIL